MAKLFPYLAFENAKSSIDYYVTFFGATLLDHSPITKEMAGQFNLSDKQLENSTMHAAFSVERQTILCSDRLTEPNAAFNSAMSICLDFDSEDSEAMKELQTLYDKIITADGLTILMPLEKQFWGGKMGMVKDKFGLQWMFHAQPYSKLE